MTQPTAAPPRVNAHLEQHSRETTALDSGSPRPRRLPAHSISTATVVALCIAVHLLAAVFIYRDVVRDLYTLFDGAPRLLVLERGLVRLTAISIFLPPIIPVALLGGVTLWLGKLRREPEVARCLALAAVPLAVDGLLRAVGVLIAPAPATIGELLELPTRFSPGPRMLLDLLDARPSPGVAYWVVVCNVAAIVSAWYVARALLGAESINVAVHGGRRRRNPTRIDALRAVTVVAGTWAGLAFVGQIALPWATQLLLQMFG
jgi:hypothetical protein